MNAETITRQLVTLKTEFGKVDRIPDGYETKLLDLLDRAPRAALEMIVGARIDFCWMPAANRLMKNFGMTWEQVLNLEAQVERGAS